MNDVIHGDCLEVMATFEPESIDAIVTDPPYGLEFMGMAWDRFDGRPNGTPRPRNEWGDFGSREHARTPADMPRIQRNKSIALQEFTAVWAREALRVAKPGAHLLAFGGTRTVHRIATAIEDAGWVIRDMLVWAYASGFPKSKASLKPAWEPIVMARKPGALRALAIDECRIDAEPWTRRNGVTGSGLRAGKGLGAAGYGEQTQQFAERESASGRWPANVILTDPIFDGGIEGVVGGGETGPAGTAVNRNREPGTMTSWMGTRSVEPGPDVTYGDTGTYSRFFLVPKASRSDREPILEPREEVPGRRERFNAHPTLP